MLSSARPFANQRYQPATSPKPGHFFQAAHSKPNISFFYPRTLAIERAGDLGGVFQGPIQRKRALKRNTLDEFHDEIAGRIGRCTDVVEVANIRMVQGGDGADFAVEALKRSLEVLMATSRPVRESCAR